MQSEPTPATGGSAHAVPDVFHIGYPRTGTTFLQKGVWARLPEAVYRTRSRVGEFYRTDDSATLAKLYEDVPKNDVGDRIFIDSEEEFSGDLYTDYLHMPERLYRVNPGAKILVCLRSQKTIIPSMYYLYVKKGGHLTYRQYAQKLIDARKFDYLPLIDAYRAVFGEENVCVLLFEDLGRDSKQFVHRVMSFIGHQREVEIDDRPLVVNARAESLSIRAMRLMNRLTGTTPPSRFMDVDERAWVMARLHWRTRLCTVPFFFTHRLQNVLPSRLTALPTTAVQPSIEAAYGDSNRKLFRVLDINIDDYNYPGSRATSWCQTT
jgi:hypothetical protein